jgi:quinohemoprotein amine dehydrogenase
MRKLTAVTAFAFAMLASFTLEAQVAGSPKTEVKVPSEPGIPVDDPLVIAKCSGCHQRDAAGNLSRISWERAAPESWQQAIKRMVRLHGVQLQPDEARKIVQYLSDTHGLAPEEAKQGIYYFEKRHLDQEKYPDVVREACVSCHPFGQAMNWRRAAEEWDLLVNMHIGYFPVVEWNSFRGRGRSETPPPPGTDTRTPVERAIEQVKKDFPLHTKEWAEWTASRRDSRLAGRWLLSASMPGKGRFVGEMVVEPGAGANEWNTKTTLRSIATGQTVVREGKGVLYTGYSWRGRSEGKTAGDVKSLREVMLVARDQNSMEGRWFWGAYDEHGYDVKLVRADERPMVLLTNVSSLRTGSNGSVTIHGDQFPTGIGVKDIDLGQGITVSKVTRQTATEIQLEVAVDAKARLGLRDVAVRRSVAPGALAVYDTVDYIKTATDTAIARLGGTTHPKGYMQFEAVGFNRGLDGKPNTSDDVRLGPVAVTWSLEEFYAIYGDDDVQFVGTLDDHGSFTPALEGPNPKRKFSRNNYGDVWAVATYRGPDAAATKDGKPLTAKCYLIVTVPQYMRWDQPEVAQ